MRTTLTIWVLVISIIVGVLGSTSVTRVGAEDAFPTRLTFVFVRPKEDPMTQWLILIYTEALGRMNIEFAFKEVPPKRASVYSDRGDVDGELGRAFDYNETHPNMIRVDEPNSLTNFSAFASTPGIALQGWESLKDTEYLVEFRRGITLCEAQLSRVTPPARLSDIATVHQGIQKLLAGRTEVYVDVEAFVLTYLKSEDFQQISRGRTVYMAGVMDQISGHAFLHKKHQALVSPLSAILRTMKEEGLFETYRDQVGMTTDDVTW